MDPSHLLNMDATITTVTEGAGDDYGDPTEETTSRNVKCWIDRSGLVREAGEQVGLDDWQQETVNLYLPAGTALTGRDRVTVEGVTYEVFGPPFDRIDPRTNQSVYVTAQLRRAT